MVASGQMVTLDSLGSVVMKCPNPTLHLAKLKHLKIFRGSPYTQIYLRCGLRVMSKNTRSPLKQADLFLS